MRVRITKSAKMWLAGMRESIRGKQQECASWEQDELTAFCTRLPCLVQVLYKDILHKIPAQSDEWDNVIFSLHLALIAFGCSPLNGIRTWHYEHLCTSQDKEADRQPTNWLKQKQRSSTAVWDHKLFLLESPLDTLSPWPAGHTADLYTSVCVCVCVSILAPV